MEPFRSILMFSRFPPQSHEQYEEKRCHAFVCDVAKDEIGLPAESLDFIVLIFVLSAVPPELWVPSVGVWEAVQVLLLMNLGSPQDGRRHRQACKGLSINLKRWSRGE